MVAGLHEPVIEVEELPGEADRYQVVGGEHRWRAARQAGRTHVLARVLPPLGHWERFRRQYQENQLRAPLDPVEQGRAILQAKTIRDIALAERL